MLEINERRLANRGLALSLVLMLFAAVAITSVSAASGATYSCFGREATIVGTEGADTIQGTNGDDVIVTLGGDDTIFAGGGRDRVCAGRGKDFIDGGAGNDWLRGEEKNDRIKGGSGRDNIFGGTGNDVIVGGFGGDKLYGDNGDDKLIGGGGDDFIYGLGGNDNLAGSADNDTLNGGNAIDHCDSSGETLINCETPETPMLAGPSITALYEAEMLRIINHERSLRGLPALVRHASFDAYAQAWSAVISTIPLPLNAAQHHSPAFTGRDFAFQSLPGDVAWTGAFENVGFSTVGGNETPADVMERLFYSPGGSGFMSSDGHRCNILESAAEGIGLGAFVDFEGNVWVAHVFFGTNWPLPSPISECANVVNR